MKVAVVHEMLVKMGGAENVVLDILEMFPDADFFTLIYNESKVGHFFPKERVKNVPAITQIPFRITRNQRFSLPFMKYGVESLDLSEYDLVITSSSGFAHGVITKPEALHVVYYHSPARYLWDVTHEHRKDIHFLAFFKKILLFFLAYIFTSLRTWDFAASYRHDLAIAASKQVRDRIRKYYKRDARVIYPSVYVEKFFVGPSRIESREYYVIASALTEFKKIDVAVRAFNEMGYPLIIIGDGAQKTYLESIAKKNITFVGYKRWEQINEYYQNARGFILAGREDFGIAPIEAMAAGLPVFGLGEGGLTESSIDGLSGAFFADKDGQDFIEKFEQFHQDISEGKYSPDLIRDHAIQFRKERFQEELYQAINEAMQK